MNLKERMILRDLARQIKDIAKSAEEIEKRERFKTINSLKRVKPPVLLGITGEIMEHFLPYKDSVQIESDPFFQGIEYWLRWRLARREKLGDDAPVSDIFHTAIDYTVTGWNDKYHSVRMNADKSGSRFEPCLINYSDINKLSKPHLTIRQKTTDETYNKVCDAIGDILRVVKGSPFTQTIGWGESMIDQYVEMRGLEQTYYDMIDEPDFIHEVMEFMTTAKLELLDEFRKHGLLVMNNEDNHIGSSSLGYTDILETKPGEAPCEKNLWGFAQAQELHNVSPDMLETFVLPYQARIINRFGLSLYGCCEAIENKVEVISRYITNLRMISVSPFANHETAAEKIGSKYVYAWKQHPGFISNFEPEAIEKDLARTLVITEKCNVVILMLDAFEFGNDYSRFRKWIDIAKRTVEKRG